MNNSPVPWREVFTDEATHTITGNVKIYESFPIPQLQTERRVWIYLPKSYNESNRSYPVYYMQDGQNMFDEATSGDASGMSTRHWNRWHWRIQH